MAGKNSKRLAISASSSGDNILIAAVAGTRYLVTHIVLIAAGTTTVKFKSSTAGADLTGAMPLVVNAGWADSNNDNGLFCTAAGESLNMVLSAAVAVTGYLNYTEYS